METDQSWEGGLDSVGAAAMNLPPSLTLFCPLHQTYRQASDTPLSHEGGPQPFHQCASSLHWPKSFMALCQQNAHSASAALQ